jgi:hypothetical protein
MENNVRAHLLFFVVFLISCGGNIKNSPDTVKKDTSVTINIHRKIKEYDKYKLIDTILKGKKVEIYLIDTSYMQSAYLESASKMQKEATLTAEIIVNFNNRRQQFVFPIICSDSILNPIQWRQLNTESSSKLVGFCGTIYLASIPYFNPIGTTNFFLFIDNEKVELVKIAGPSRRGYFENYFIQSEDDVSVIDNDVCFRNEIRPNSKWDELIYRVNCSNKSVKLLKRKKLPE